MSMYSKKAVRFTKALFKDICNHISRDISVASLYRKDPTKYPRPETFSRWASGKPEVREMYETARKLQMTTIDDEYTDMLNTPPAHTGDKSEDAHNYKVWQTKLNHYRDRLARLGPIFNKTYDKASKVELDHQNAPQIVIQSYIPEPIMDTVVDNDDDNVH